MSNKPLVSVIIPVYNAEKYISRCIDSILSSDYENLEVIIVDDGSFDSSLLIANEYKKKDPRVKIYSQKNKGAGQARNKGLDNASGEYVLFVDADDILCCSAISKSINVILTNPVDIVMFNYQEIDSNYSNCSLERRISQDDYDLEVWSYSDFWNNYYGNNLVWCVVPWGKLYKKKLFKSVRFENKYYEDEYAINKLIKKNVSIAIMNDILYFYRIHGESTMAKPFNERYLDKVDCFHQRLKMFIEEDSCFCGDAALMLIHGCNILKKHISVIGSVAIENRINEAKKLVKKTFDFKLDKKQEKRINLFLHSPHFYYFFYYSNFVLKVKQLSLLPHKITYYFSIKKSLSIVSKCLYDGYYSFTNGDIKIIDKSQVFKFNIFKVKEKNKMDLLFDEGRIIKTQYKTILICKDFTFYFYNNKKRYFDIKNRFSNFIYLLKYPSMELSFDDSNLLVVGKTIIGTKYKRNEKFNLVLDYLFSFYDKSEYVSKQITIGNISLSVPFCVQHGDLKDSNIVWDGPQNFCLIDLEAINEKPIFFDMFFYILISKKQKAHVIFENKMFMDKLRKVAVDKGVDNDNSIDDLLLIYLNCLINGYIYEHTISYYNYYLKDLLSLIFGNNVFVKCQNYLNFLKTKKALL